MCIAAGLLFLLRGLSEFLVVTIMQVTIHLKANPCP